MTPKNKHPRREVHRVEVRLSGRKKLLFSVFAVAATLTLGEVLLALVGVRPSVATQDPYVGFQSRIPLFVEGLAPDGTPVYQTAPNKLVLFNEQRFPAKKGRDAYRIFTLGGSTTYGRPYDDRTSFGGWLRLFLNAADPGTDWQVINCGGVSYASYRVAALMEELIRYDPDLFIIYTGHNEFLEQRTYSGIIEEHPAITEVNLLLGKSRIATVMHRIADRLWTDPREEAREQYRLTGEVSAMLDNSAGLELYHRDDELQQKILAHYRFNLERMIVLARSVDAGVVFVQPPVNLKDFSPFKSECAGTASRNEQDTRERLHGTGVRKAQAGEHDAARNDLEQALRIDERCAETHFEFGRVLFALADYESARAAFERAVTEDVCPLRILPEMQKTLGEVCDKHDVTLVDFKGMLEDRCRQEHGHDILGKEYFLDHVHLTIGTHRMLGRSLLDHLTAQNIAHPVPDWGDEKAAAIAAKLEGTLDRRDHAIACGKLAGVLRWARKFEEADRLAALAGEVMSDDAQVVALRGTTLGNLGKPDEAIAQYRRALQIDPANREVHLKLAEVLAKEGRLEEALAQYRRALELDPSDAGTYHSLGLVLIKLGKSREALERFQQALRIDPLHQNTHLGLGVALMNEGKLNEAASHFRQELHHHPESTDAYIELAIVSERLNRVEECIQHYHQALKIDPDNLMAHHNLGVILARQGKTQSAIEHYEHALRVQPDSVQAHLSLGTLLLSHRRLREAGAHFERVLQISPGEPQGYANLSLMHVYAGDVAQAIRLLRDGLKVAPDDVRLLNALAWILATRPEAELRNGEEALRLARRACELTGYKNPYCLDTLAAAYAEVGQFDDAEQTARDAIARAMSVPNPPLAQSIEQRLAAYSAHRPVRAAGR